MPLQRIFVIGLLVVAGIVLLRALRTPAATSNVPKLSPFQATLPEPVSKSGTQELLPRESLVKRGMITAGLVRPPNMLVRAIRGGAVVT